MGNEMKAKSQGIRTLWLFLALVGAVGLPLATWAHEGHHHQAMGTVKSVAETELVVETADGKAQAFVLSEATKYLRGKAESKREAVAVGERAVVMYEKKEGADRALEVRLPENHDG